MSSSLLSCPGLLALAVACTHGASAAATPAPTASAAEPSKEVLATLCGAGRLPRLDESRVELGALLAAAERGTVAVTLSDARARTSPDCTLPGAYTEVNGTGGGRFFATNRAIFRTDEVDAKCRSATHLVAAYVTWRDAAVARLAAILVPLPCPSASDLAPAPGCVGAGLTGPERVERAKPLAERLMANEARKPMMLEALTAFALAPDEAFAVRVLTRGFSSDYAFDAQVGWLQHQYMYVRERVNEPLLFVLDPNRGAPPFHNSGLSTRGHYLDPLAKPVFMYCFLDHFTPDTPWTPAERKRVP